MSLFDRTKAPKVVPGSTEKSNKTPDQKNINFGFTGQGNQEADSKNKSGRVDTLKESIIAASPASHKVEKLNLTISPTVKRGLKKLSVANEITVSAVVEAMYLVINANQDIQSMVIGHAETIYEQRKAFSRQANAGKPRKPRKNKSVET